jgi:hypothetical protein
MSINHSSASCDWCRKKLDDGADIACGKCQQDVESENSGLKDTIKDLQARIDDLESRLP